MLLAAAFAGIALLAPMAPAEPAVGPHFVPLFAGGTIAQWRIVGGTGGQVSYELKDGVLTGKGNAKRNAFLYSPGDHADFILEVDVRLTRGNSGIQVRSIAEHEQPDQPAGRMVGLQVEIDPTDRRWSGGVYDEGRSGWLDDLSDNEVARAAFKMGEWNAYRIECSGDRIRTWVNEVPCADLTPTKERSGRIGFQVHSGDSLVEWRNARIADIECASAATTAAAANAAATLPSTAAEFVTALNDLSAQFASADAVVAPLGAPTAEPQVTAPAAGASSAPIASKSNRASLVERARQLGDHAVSLPAAEIVAIQAQLAAVWNDSERAEDIRVCALRAVCALPADLRNDATRALAFDTIEFICMPGKMAWDIKEAKATAGRPIQIVMHNADTLQHNLLVCSPGSLMEIGTKGDLMGQSPNGKDLQFVPPSPNVLQVMGLIDPDKTGILCFIAPKAGNYPIVCTYPGHWRTMNAKLKISGGGGP